MDKELAGPLALKSRQLSSERGSEKIPVNNRPVILRLDYDE